jgi:hypothetical protein
MCGPNVHHHEQERQFCVVNGANHFCSVDEVAHCHHDHVSIICARVESNLYHPLDDLNDSQPTTFLVTLAKQAVGFCRCRASRDVLGLGGEHVGPHISEDHTIVALPVVMAGSVSLLAGAREHAEWIDVQLSHRERDK